jgi:Carbamoyl-phosphate synthase L chain, ATP binding domain
MSEKGPTGRISPTVLLISTSPSFSPARLSMALRKQGFETDAVCPAQHTLRKTRAVRRIYSYNCWTPFRSVTQAITAAKPNLVIPCDDWAASLLHDLYLREFRSDSEAQILSLIERSLGAPKAFQFAYDRTALLELAMQEGLRVPEFRVVRSREDLTKWGSASGFPAVLKANGTSGGDGVRIVRTLDEAERAFRALEAPPLLAKALKRALIDKDMALLWPSLRRQRYVVNIQSFIEGQDATSAVACWRGEVLASLHFSVLNKQDAGGPSTVLRLIENPDMSAAAEKITRRLNLSGFYGFDFILESATEKGYLIEMNPRATQVCHLPLGRGHDLPAALYAVVVGEEIAVTPRVTDKETIALFPQEWLKNPASTYLSTAYHDVPWEEPEFVLACMKRRRSKTGWYSIQKWSQALSKTQRP